MQKRVKIIKIAAAVLSATTAGLFGMAGYYSSKLPSTMKAVSSSEIYVAEYPELSCTDTRESVSADMLTFPEQKQVTFSLFGAVPVKTVQVREQAPIVLAAGGTPFGIKLLMEGVMVTELGSICDKSGRTVCPAEEAGIKVGDIIRLADGKKVTSNKGLQSIISASSGEEIKITAERDGSEFTVSLKPVFSRATGQWRGGMWVRDSIAGIGTMTFINKQTGEFAGLGHPICDSDTGELVPLHSGEAVPVELSDAKRGEKGIPGELRGVFSKDKTYGVLYKNSGCGIFGRLTDDALEELCKDSEEFPLGYRQEVSTGSAEIFTSVSGHKPEKYSIEIERVDLNSGDSTKNMVIRITDDRLLDLTGGIIQGMSGSPVIQDGKIVGAVTHVFVSDPTRGYAIFAENMAEYLES